MSAPVDAAAIFEAVEATWPAARLIRQGDVILRDGQGGGKRVSAATAERPLDALQIAQAEQAMEALGQTSLFMIRAGETALDQALDARGYEVIDPVVALATTTERLLDTPIPRLKTFCIWEPLAIMREIWAKGGVGPARIEVMGRAACKTGVFARHNDRPAGVGFVACHNGIAMVHAVEVLATQHRQGVAGWIMRQAAHWAKAQGAETIALLVTRANTGANGLYSGLGFQEVSAYHYRQKTIPGEMTLAAH